MEPIRSGEARDAREHRSEHVMPNTAEDHNDDPRLTDTVKEPMPNGTVMDETLTA
jgi:hypothetical protein